MTNAGKITVLATLLSMAATGALAATLRVALQDDPDSLDPATGGTYTGRIVFDAMCDKLLDIDEGLADRAAAGHGTGAGTTTAPPSP